ncbi:MAG TPA: sialate O-acetylesterase [Prolixibacteraceae bacterium]|nr:sialate O-acetylesterase [Prolixibacteraceae bacterium]
MKQNTYFLLSILFLFAGTTSAKKFKVFYLGGQSNMDGYGYVKELPEELNQPVKGAFIFHGNTAPDTSAVDGNGVWEVLKPGHGTGHQSSAKGNKLSDRVGIEITFARELQRLMPGENIALVKYSKGGTSIHLDAAGKFGSWDPDFSVGNGVNQYDHFLATVKNAFSAKDIDGDGELDELIPAGIVWMQGESDAHVPEIAEEYAANLKRLVDLIRAAFLTDDLPIVIGRISDSGNDSDGKVWDYGNIVRWQQARFVNRDENAALVTTTDNYDYSDKWHYDTAGYIDLGKQFARAVVNLMK